MTAVSAGLALASCYGTTLLLGLLSLIDVSLAVNARAWAAAILFLAGLTVIGLMLRMRQHRRAGPLAVAVLGLGLIVWVMLRSYDTRVEATGFSALVAAVLWDRRSAIPVPNSRN